MAESQTKRLRRVFELLRSVYRQPKWRRSGPALDVLIKTVLSQNTNDRNSGEGFRRLKAAFRTWDAVAKADRRAVAAAIRVSGLANIKSGRIREILSRVHSDCGRHSLVIV